MISPRMMPTPAPPQVASGQAGPAVGDVPVRLPGAPADAQRPHPPEGTVPVRDGTHALVPGQSRVHGHGGATPVPGRGRRAGQFFPGECLGPEPAGSGQLRGRFLDGVGVGVEHAVHQPGYLRRT
jgi:hypothetical protein